MATTRIKRYLAPGILVIVSLWCVNFLVGLAVGGIDNAGVMGDLFGAVNSLFSGLALAGVVAAIMLQLEEMKATHAALALQKEETELLKLEFKEQSAIQKDLVHLSALSALIEYGTDRLSILHTDEVAATEAEPRRLLAKRRKLLEKELDGLSIRVKRILSRLEQVESA